MNLYKLNVKKGKLNMNKTEFVEAVAKEAKASKAAANEMVNAVVAVVTKALKKGESVQITGFGTFEVAKRAARKGRNPATGKEIKIPASKAPKFKAGAVLKYDEHYIKFGSGSFGVGCRFGCRFGALYQKHFGRKAK